MTLDRREFLKVAGVGAGALLTGCASASGAAPRPAGSRLGSSHVIVVGAGAFGGWAALNLQRLGARVTLVDMYGPGNSRSTSGDETRGVRSSYGDRIEIGELWMQWAYKAMGRWKEFDAEFGTPAKNQVYFTTGDLFIRFDWDPTITRNRDWWTKYKIPFEVLTQDEVRKRWPVVQLDDMKAVLFETNAGIVRARRATQLVAEVFQREGGNLVIGRIVPPTPGRWDGRTLKFTNGDTLAGDTVIFAVGPWLGKTFALMENRMRTPLGIVAYFATPPGDDRFTYPNLPTWNFPGTTGWAALPVDNRGFRVRGGGGGGGGGQANQQNQQNQANAATNAQPATSPAATANQNVSDPDLSSRWVEPQRLDGPRRFVATRFPLLKDAPIAQTWACHYEQSSSRNFIVDRHPNLPNVWIAGGGNAEGFKMGPVIGEYIARRVLGSQNDPDFDREFRIPDTTYLEVPPRPGDDD